MNIDKDNLGLRQAYHIFLQAFGVVTQDGLAGQIQALSDLNELVKAKRYEVGEKSRVEHALATREQRIKPDDPYYMVHMRHCYGWNYDFCDFGEEPTSRHACKYGEDDICPAAMFADPWAEYCRMEEAKKSG